MIEAINCVRILSAVYTSGIIVFLEVLQFPEHHITYCGVFGEHVHCFTVFEVLLYLYRWNWLFIRSLLELRCGISTWMTSVGAAPLAGVAPLATLLCKLLTTPSIIPYLGKSFLDLQGQLQQGQ
jgi:hypothetical protein